MNSEEQPLTLRQYIADSVFKELLVDETPMDTQATVVPDQRTELNSEEQPLTWGQYITDSVYSLYDTVVNFMYGDSAQQEL